MQNVLSPIENNLSLQEQAYLAIKSSILTLAFSPGTQLLESELADQLKISKTPVRDALQRLSREKFVEIIPRKGVYVTKVTVKDIKEVSEIRSSLVGLAAKRATSIVTEQDIFKARTILEEGDRALERGDDESWLQYNNQFHAWLLEHSNNQFLSNLLQGLDEYFERIQRLAASVPGELLESNKEHYAILDSISTRDPNLAEAVACKHILSIGEQAVLRLESIG